MTLSMRGYRLPATGIADVEMPMFSVPRYVAEVGGAPHVFALVDDTEPDTTTARFAVVATGTTLPRIGAGFGAQAMMMAQRHIGSFRPSGAADLVHVFVLDPESDLVRPS